MFRRWFSLHRTPVVRRRFQPCLEALEGRWVPATASFAKGTLTVTVAAADTVINFTQDPNLPVGHISADSSGTFFFNDPAGVPPSRFVKNIVVKVPAGANVDVNFAGLAITGSATVNSASTAGTEVDLTNSTIGKSVKFVSTATAANDSLSTHTVFIGGSLTASLSGSTVDNTADLSTTDIGGNLVITGLGGDDEVFLNNMKVAGAASFKLGAGANGLTVTAGLHIGSTLVYKGATGIDDIDVPNDMDVDSAATFSLGDGDNNVSIAPVTGVEFGALTISAGLGDDTISIDAAHIRTSATFNLGDSIVDNGLALQNNTIIGGALIINGGAGVETLTLTDLVVVGSTTIKTVGGSDTLVINDSAFLSAALFDGAAGNDVFFIETNIALAGLTSFGRKLTILGGADNDQLILGDSNHANTILTINGATTTFDGGAGGNTFANDLGDFNFNGTPPTIITWP